MGASITDTHYVMTHRGTQIYLGLAGKPETKFGEGTRAENRTSLLVVGNALLIAPMWLYLGNLCTFMSAFAATFGVSPFPYLG